MQPTKTQKSGLASLKLRRKTGFKNFGWRGTKPIHTHQPGDQEELSMQLKNAVDLAIFQSTTLLIFLIHSSGVLGYHNI